jgi:hypothetical protein
MMDEKRDRRFLLAAGLLVLASWAAVGWVLWAKWHRLYTTQSETALVEWRLPDGRYLVRLERALVVRQSLPGPSERAQVVDRRPDGRYLVRLLSEETAVVEIPEPIARSQPTVTVFRRAYLGGFKTQWRTINYFAGSD